MRGSSAFTRRHRRARTTAALACGALLTAGAGVADANGPGHGPGPDPGHGPGRVVKVASTPQNVVWGGFPIGSAPVATVKQGEVVQIDTLSQSGLTNRTMDPTAYLGQLGVKPWEVLPDATAFWNSIPTRAQYGGGHILTGPVYIEGAQPGDTLEVQILDVEPRVPYGINSTSSTSGVFGTGYPGWREGDAPLNIPAAPSGSIGPGVNQHLYRTSKIRGQLVGTTTPGINVPLKPFFGTIGLAPQAGVFVGRTPTTPPPPLGVQTSTAPGPYAGNLDDRNLSAGSTLYIPVFQPGGQFFVGDSHGVQGDGEVSGTAIEQSMVGTFRFIVHHQTTGGPAAEDSGHYYQFGIDWDLDRAMRLATQHVVDFLVANEGLTTADAYSFASVAVNFVVSEAVDGTQVVTGEIPKNLLPDGGKHHQ